VRFAVGLEPVWPGTQVADRERAACERMDGGAVAGAVVGHHGLLGDAVAGVERDRSAPEADGGRCLLITQDLDVGQRVASSTQT
jgi:hypothetical protein